jgi:deoxyribonuclease-4
MIRFGVHCSLRNGFSGAVEEAREKKCESMQLFARSPRMWKMKSPNPEEIAECIRLREAYHIYPFVVHTPYLPNLATSKKRLYRLSKQSLHDDLVIAEQLQTNYLVIHPGAYSPESTLRHGIRNIVTAINAAFAEVPGKTVLLLENVAGGGRRIGSSFAELAQMISGIRDKQRIGICLDTAHAFAAGYDLSASSGIDAMIKEFDETVGLGYLKMLHFNDSLVPLGSRKDRHEHLGKGCIGTKGFKYLVSRIENIADAGILETPKDTPSSDQQNLSLLFAWRRLTIHKKIHRI